jgi:hypothetical protein
MAVSAHKKTKYYVYLYLGMTFLGLGTSYYFWPLFFSQMLWCLLINWRNNNQSSGLFRAQVAILLLATPLVGVAIFQSTESYLESSALQFFRYFSQFGFLFEPDKDANLHYLLPAGVSSIFSIIGTLLIFAGLLAPGKTKPLGKPGEIQGPTMRQLSALTVFVTIIMLLAAIAFIYKDPAKTKLILASCITPGLILLASDMVLKKNIQIFSLIGKLLDRIFRVDDLGNLIKLLFIFPLLLLTLVSFFIPFFASREAMVFTPYLLILISMGIFFGISKLNQPVSSIVFVIVLIAILTIHYQSVLYNKSRPESPTDYHGLTKQMIPQFQDSDLIFIQRHWVTDPIFYYLPASKYRYVSDDYINAIYGSSGSRIWVLSFSGLPMSENILSALEGYKIIRSFQSLRIKVDLYVRNPEVDYSL